MVLALNETGLVVVWLKFIFLEGAVWLAEALGGVVVLKLNELVVD